MWSIDTFIVVTYNNVSQNCTEFFLFQPKYYVFSVCMNVLVWKWFKTNLYTLLCKKKVWKNHIFHTIFQRCVRIFQKQLKFSCWLLDNDNILQIISTSCILLVYYPMKWCVSKVWIVTCLSKIHNNLYEKCVESLLQDSVFGTEYLGVLNTQYFDLIHTSFLQDIKISLFKIIIIVVVVVENWFHCCYYFLVFHFQIE